MQTAKLTERLRSGDKEALFSIMTMYYSDLFRYGMKFTADKDLTKDIIGQFFLHLWDRRSKFAAADNTKGYLMVSFKHFLLEYLRKISLQLNISEVQAEPWEYPYEDYIIAWQNDEALRAILKNAVEALPPRQRELVQLRFYEQLTHEQIAMRTSLSIRSVYNHLHEALKRLRSPVLKERITRNILTLATILLFAC